MSRSRLLKNALLTRFELGVTRIGKLSFTHDFANGYPTEETVRKLYDERDFQRAVQAYIWAMPASGEHQLNVTGLTKLI